MTLADVPGHAATYLLLAFSALAAGSAGGITAGVLGVQFAPLRPVLLALGNLARVVPSLAVLTFMLPLLGVGFLPAFAALMLLAAAPVLINTDVGLRSAPAAALDAAAGMGMTRAQTLLRVQWPLALPVIFTGVRTAATEVIASAVLASFVGAGGLGEFITSGLQANDARTLWIGVVSIGIIAVIAEIILAALQRRIGEYA